MLVDRKLIFDAAKVLGAKFKTAADVAVMDNAIDSAFSLPVAPKPAAPVAPPAPVAKSSRPIFTLSDISKQRLANVHPKLKQCVELAIGYCPVDFRVQQGERSLADQKKAVASGNSRTMKSKHLLRPDGQVWAVDLVVLKGGVVTWEFNEYAGIAWAMDKAATELGIAGNIRWGCAWDRVLSDFGGDVKAYLQTAKDYAARRRAVGKSALLDAPHFEWVS